MTRLARPHAMPDIAFVKPALPRSGTLVLPLLIPPVLVEIR